MHTAIETIIRLFDEKGASGYGGEPVTQLQHALQCAALAKQANARASLISAALLHDIGHLLHDLPDDAPERGMDDMHETAASGFLERYFVAAVTEPVRLHVQAKRYLCTIDEQYFNLLSPPSVLSLHLQGGLLNENEIAAFEDTKFSNDAIRLRKWDDEAKYPNLLTDPLECFIPYLEQSLLQNQNEEKIGIPFSNNT